MCGRAPTIDLMDNRFCTIVVAIDLRRDAGDAERVGAALARAADLPTEFVAEGSTDTTDGADWEDLRRRIALVGLDLSPRYLLGSDQPGLAIVEHVANREGALLVMATTTWGSSGPYRLDATVEEVLGHVLAPVLIIGPNAAPSPTGMATPVVVVDGSDIAESAMPVVGAWVRTFPGGVARVVEVLPAAHIPADDVLGHVHRYMNGLAAHGVAASTGVLRGGEPASALVGYANEIDGAVLVVSSPRWAGEPSHWFNTTRRLIQHSTRPVLVVPADLPGYRGSSRGSMLATTPAR
jgi:nucleotide-binding universal stress UspA family protein